MWVLEKHRLPIYHFPNLLIYLPFVFRPFREMA